MGRIDRFLERRFVLGQRDDDQRFQGVPEVRHASNVGKCQRQNYYKLKRETEDTYSPYFELGNRFEDIYGAVLASEYGDFDHDEISNLNNNQLIQQCDVVQQDVGCTIHLGNNDGEFVTISGESDWVVQYPDTKPVDHVTLYQDGRRIVKYQDGTVDEPDRVPINFVIETKTSTVKWREKYGHKFEHEYQVGTYMWAFDSTGEIVYIERDDLSEIVFEFSYDQDRRDDIAFRSKILHKKTINDELPEANPPRDNICKYCDFNDECKIEGGARWEDGWESIESRRRND